MARYSNRIGIPALVGLLLVVFTIAGLLVHEAWITAKSRRDMAERGLQDFAAYASWSAARAGDNMLAASLSTLFRGLVGHRVEAGESLPPLESLLSGAKYLQQCDCATDVPADYYFRFDAGSGSLEVTPRPPRAAEGEVGWAAAKVGSFSPAREAAKAVAADESAWLKSALSNVAPRPNAGFSLHFAANGDSARVIGIVPQRDASGQIVGTLGFVGSARRLADALFTQLWNNPKILPQAITRGLPNDSLLVATVTTADGREIYRSAGWMEGLRSDTASLFSLGGGMNVRVGLRPDATVRLEGGIVPASRLPVWIGLLLMTGILTVVIIRNLQREHELARLRLEFSAGVSHELRTPIAQILLFGETLKLGRTRSEPERRDAANVIVREARRLMQVVENTLVFSRAERPVVSLSPKQLRLAPLIEEIAADFLPLASARDVTISTRLDFKLYGYVDPAAFRQMLINLLDNAVKYGPPGQAIRIGLTGAHAGRVQSGVLARKYASKRPVNRITVDDEGPGVTGAAREDIWVSFARGANGRQPVGTGCGLGLAVVRELAERHNGSAWVEDTPSGHGSRFVIELPDVPETQHPEATHEDGAPVHRAGETVSA